MCLLGEVGVGSELGVTILSFQFQVADRSSAACSHLSCRMGWTRPVSSALFLLLMMSATTFVVHAEKVTTDVIIIGAGVSGITAGKVLSDSGVTNFLILEGTDRIGGRVRNHDFAGLKVEIGANWVEGVNGDELNPVQALALEVNLRTSLSELDNITSNIYDASGPLPPQTRASKVTDDQNAYVESLGTLLTKNGQDDISILTAQRLYGSVPSTPVEMVLDYDLYDGEFAEPPRVTSLKNTQPLPTWENFGPDSYFVADQRGYATILQPLATYLRCTNGTYFDPRLKFNKVVTALEYSDKGVKVSTEDGSSYSAKAAIVTVSLGVLQSRLIKFKPDLPFWKLEALFEFDMAIYTKIFLKFPKKFWRTGPGTEFFLYADDSRGYYPVWQHLDNEYPDAHIIFVTVTDDESRRIEQQSDNETQAEVMEVLRTMYGPDIPDPEAILIPRWWSDRLFRGTFSNWPIGVTSAEYEELRAPIGRLFFSGEHTSIDYNGYIHGAYYAGEYTAADVLKCLKKHKCPSSGSKKKTHTNKKDVDLHREHWARKTQEKP